MLCGTVWRERGWGKRVGLALMASTVLGLSGSCLPNNFWSGLIANSVSAVTGVLLSDFLQVFLPPV